jgi:hypothetical protein
VRHIGSFKKTQPIQVCGAQALIAQSDAYMTALYPPESNHLESIESLKSPNVLFLGVFIEGTLASCGAVKVLENDTKSGYVLRPPFGSYKVDPLSIFMEKQLEKACEYPRENAHSLAPQYVLLLKSEGDLGRTSYNRGVLYGHR